MHGPWIHWCIDAVRCSVRDAQRDESRTVTFAVFISTSAWISAFGVTDAVFSIHSKWLYIFSDLHTTTQPMCVCVFVCMWIDYMWTLPRLLIRSVECDFWPVLFACGMYTVGLKYGANLFLSVTLSKINGFQCSFHYSILKWTIHVKAWTSPTSPNYCCYTTLWKSKNRKCMWTQLHLLMLTTK